MRRFVAASIGLALAISSAAYAADQQRSDVALSRRSVEVKMMGFEPGRRIHGTVSGLAAGEPATLKVLVYVLTDKWYIHPEAAATPGRGFAAIDPDGRWEIDTVWRGHQAIKLALVVVPKGQWAPAVVEVGDGGPEDALRSRLLPLALSVLDAPAGI